MKKNKKDLIFIIVLMVFIFLIAYFGINYSNLKNKKCPKCEKEIKYVDISGDNDTELVCEESTIYENDCNEYIDYVYPLIVKAKESGFVKTYFPEDYKAIKIEDIKCKNIKVLNNVLSGIYYDVSITGTSGFQCFLTEKKCYEYSIDDTFHLSVNGLSFMYAKNIVQKDYDELTNKYKFAGLYPTKYTGGDTLILEVREYKGEVDNSGKLYATYIVNFKTRTFEKK